MLLHLCRPRSRKGWAEVGNGQKIIGLDVLPRTHSFHLSLHVSLSQWVYSPRTSSQLQSPMEGQAGPESQGEEGRSHSLYTGRAQGPRKRVGLLEGLASQDPILNPSQSQTPPGSFLAAHSPPLTVPRFPITRLRPLVTSSFSKHLLFCV